MWTVVIIKGQLKETVQEMSEIKNKQALRSAFNSYFMKQFVEHACAEGTLPNERELSDEELLFATTTLSDFSERIVEAVGDPTPITQIDVRYHREIPKKGQIRVNDRVICEFELPTISLENMRAQYKVELKK